MKPAVTVVASMSTKSAFVFLSFLLMLPLGGFLPLPVDEEGGRAVERPCPVRLAVALALDPVILALIPGRRVRPVRHSPKVVNSADVDETMVVNVD